MPDLVGWFPRYSRTGKLTYEVSDLAKFRPQWMGEREIWHNHTHVVIEGLMVAPSGDTLTAGFNRWATCASAIESILLSNGEVLDGMDPTISPNGSILAYLLHGHTESKTLVVNEAHVHVGPISRPRAGNRGIAWNEHDTDAWYLPYDGFPRQIGTGFAPIPLDNGYVLVYTQTGLALIALEGGAVFPWDNGGEAYNPDGYADETRHVIRCAFSSAQGVIGFADFDVTDQQWLTVPPLPPDPEPVPPDPEPEPEPIPPVPEVDRMLTVDLTTPLIKAVTGEKVSHEDGTISVKCPKGYLSIDSEGEISFKPDIGPDEKFHLSGSALVVTNTFGGVKTWILPCVETR